MGTLSMPSSNAKITALPSANVAEQTAASSSGIFSYQWTAPAAGAGNVRIFAAGIAANRDGNDNSADFHVETTLAISENTGVAVENIAIQSLNLYPNPTQYLLNVSAYLTQAADMQIDIVTLDGKIAQQSQQYLSAGEQQIQLSVANLPAGVYQFRMNDGKNKTSKLFYKF